MKWNQITTKNIHSDVEKFVHLLQCPIKASLSRSKRKKPTYSNELYAVLLSPLLTVGERGCAHNYISVWKKFPKLLSVSSPIGMRRKFEAVWLAIFQRTRRIRRKKKPGSTKNRKDSNILTNENIILLFGIAASLFEQQQNLWRNFSTLTAIYSILLQVYWIFSSFWMPHVFHLLSFQNCFHMPFLFAANINFRKHFVMEIDNTLSPSHFPHKLKPSQKGARATHCKRIWTACVFSMCLNKTCFVLFLWPLSLSIFIKYPMRNGEMVKCLPLMFPPKWLV